MPEYRLHYFNGRGAAEPARLLFALADVMYEDVRYEKEDWPLKKTGYTELYGGVVGSIYKFGGMNYLYFDKLPPFTAGERDLRLIVFLFSRTEMPLGALPVLEIDGKMITQSQAIIRYLAREYDFHGSNNIETFQIDEMHEAVIELQREVYNARFEKDETKKKEIHQTLEDTIIPKFMNFFERRLTENNGAEGHFIGDRMTLADVLIYNIRFNIEQFTNVALDKWPRVMAVCKKVEANPKIDAWLKKRPFTDY